MLDKLMTQEEQEALVKKVWDEQKQKLEESVANAIRQEMGYAMASMSKKLVQAELRKLIEPMIEEKKEQLKKAAESIVDKMSSRLESLVIDQMRGTFAGSYHGFAEQLAQNFQGRLRSVMEKLLTYDYKTGKYVEKTDE